jgi:hypothetical protein
MLALSVVDRRFEPRSGQTKDYKIGMYCFFAKNAPVRRKSKDWLDRNQDNVSEWSDNYTTDASIICKYCYPCKKIRRYIF